MPRFTTSANCTGTLSAAQKTPETARPRSETQPEWGKRGRPPPAMRGPEAATPRVTRYSATASAVLKYAFDRWTEQDKAQLKYQYGSRTEEEKVARTARAA